MVCPRTAYIGIMTLQPDKLDGAYEQAFDGIQGFLDQAQKRNAIPDIPADARDEISLIQDDDDGLVFMITSQSNVYNCLFGAGHGAEKVNGKYLVITQYEFVRTRRRGSLHRQAEEPPGGSAGRDRAR